MTICLGVGLFGFIFLGTSVLPIPECLFPSLGLGSFQPQFFSVCFWLLFLFLLLLQSPICIDWQALHYSIGLLYCFFKKFGFLSAVLNGWFPLFYLPLRYPIGAVSKADSEGINLHTSGFSPAAACGQPADAFPKLAEVAPSLLRVCRKRGF